MYIKNILQLEKISVKDFIQSLLAMELLQLSKVYGKNEAPH